ncbi:MULTISPECIES: DUF192 domain-containing protein [Streptomyces]|uniref:DUF192 domain-containing protein n=1 Tax=Streptomyces tsukubensis (strain DSM 42081 / NBRC 108919 / NRRL 18488 / 9993) TaxID=1114943 RepID=A0A7G3UED4_STRT9|nr:MULTISPECIES: DUF192 domain-containing protein [Streptomyces]AZK96267.1 hypothetical protein B7R87_22140 [Streptomyces tsukubensis]MYS67356.1 DUF192 domain-containing protein [Streptomyces sp. SID5473]QKM67725.1 DUF192 domain-containing protein [Streptomyces tsukubensis NRRL18488]QWA14220.1 hypothetical protein [Streptomyces tsukubensis]TAI44121.1 DUF192 domain-containing protein [Streptomyces tsukubensis]
MGRVRRERRRRWWWQRRRLRCGPGTLRVVGGRAVDGGPGDGPGIPLEIAASYGTRRRGLLGRDGVTGAMLLTPCNAVHTLGMRFAVDVAYLDAEFRVVARHTLPPRRLALPRPRARHVLEAAAGAMEEWGVRPGVRLVVEQGVR